LDSIAFEVTYLYKYCRQESTLFFKILKKVDKVTKSAVARQYIVRLESEDWWAAASKMHRVDNLIVRLSSAYGLLRKHRGENVVDDRRVSAHASHHRSKAERPSAVRP
jgi:SPX domain protein involved in polyphosphate accumulation